MSWQERHHRAIPERIEPGRGALVGAGAANVKAAAAAGEIDPTMGLFDCRMIGSYPTSYGPLRTFVDDMLAQEGKDKVLSLSLVHGFPWADIPGIGTRMLALTDGDQELAEKLAALAPGDLNHVYYTTGGSCANDSAIRMIHYYNNLRGKPNKKKIISRVHPDISPDCQKIASIVNEARDTILKNDFS